LTLNCIIIDDEPIARQGLKEYIADIDFLALKGEFGSALKAGDLLSQGEIDLLLLDIEMPRINGLDFLKSLPRHPLTILTTAYPQYALQGYELDVVDYLLKPFSFDRFLKAVLKARNYLENANKNLRSATTAEKADYFFIKADNKLIKLAYDEVLFAESLQNYVSIHTSNKKYLTYLTMKNLEEQLPASQFVKVHKSYLVAAGKVDMIEGNEIAIGSHRIPISRNNRDEVLEKILQNRLLRR